MHQSALEKKFVISRIEWCSRGETGAKEHEGGDSSGKIEQTCLLVLMVPAMWKQYRRKASEHGHALIDWPF